MKKNFLLILLIFFISLSAESKILKKNAQYTGKALIEKQTMLDAGSWFLILKQCKATYAKKLRLRIGELYW